jgi:hypothetical protein
LPGTNTPAYFALSSATKETSFITLTPGVNVIKLFYLSLMMDTNKLECLHVLKLGQLFVGKGRCLSYHSDGLQLTSQILNLYQRLVRINPLAFFLAKHLILPQNYATGFTGKY